MISRVADHCFWFGRYLERAESTARLLQVTSSLALDADLSQLQCWQPVVITAGEEGRFVSLLSAAAMADAEAVQEYLCFNAEVPVSLKRSIGSARENARSIRETISLEAWESINELHLWMQGPLARALFLEERYGFYRHIRRETQLCLGLLRGTMLHDAPLDFIWLGVVLERTGQTARMLDVHHHAVASAAPQPAPVGAQPASLAPALPAVIDVSLWLSLLRACYGFEPFMKSHRGPVTGQAVASFLVFESRFPRAVRHCLRRAREWLTRIRPGDSRLPGLRSLERLRALEELLDARAGEPLDPKGLHQLLTAVVDGTHAACDEIAVELLSAAAPSPPPPPEQPRAHPPTQVQVQVQAQAPAGAAAIPAGAGARTE